MIQTLLTTMALTRAYHVSQYRGQGVCLAPGSCDMIPLFPRRYPGATSMAAIDITTPSWVQPSSIQAMSMVTGRRSVTPFAPSLGSNASTCVPGQGMRRDSSASREYMLLTSCIRGLLMLRFRMSSVLLEADRVPLFPSTSRASRYTPRLDISISMLKSLIVALPLYIEEVFNFLFTRYGCFSRWFLW